MIARKYMHSVWYGVNIASIMRIYWFAALCTYWAMFSDHFDKIV